MKPNNSSPPKIILLIEDDELEQEILRWTFEKEGFEVICAGNGLEGLRQFYESHPDLVLVDIEMPQMDGHTLCKRIREISNIPIIVISGEATDAVAIKSLELGADDYITKSATKDLLVARTRAVLRRASMEPTAKTPTRTYSDGYLMINLDERRVIANGEQIRLSPTEFRLLEMLVSTAPRVVSYRSLLENVWGFEYIDDLDYLRVYIWHLRNKLEPNSKDPIYIINELGVGYRFQRRF